MIMKGKIKIIVYCQQEVWMVGDPGLRVKKGMYGKQIKCIAARKNGR